VLKPSSPIPLYFQLQEQLRSKIENGEFPSGSALPTEAQLSETYRVSRATVREALRVLVELGLIEKRRGLGSFVSKRKLGEYIPGLYSFSMEMRSRGHNVKSVVLHKEMVAAPSHVAIVLNVEEGSPVLNLKRLRFVDDEPILISESFLPSYTAIDDDFTDSVYKLFREKYDLNITHGEATIEADLASEEVANLLRINAHAAILRVRWVAQTEDNHAIEFSEGIYRGDRYRYVIHLRK
jgi:GntR family transcriptional regulator